MGRILLVCRLAARDLRRHPAQAGLLLLAITAAAATLTLGLALRGVTSRPYQQTRAATNGPDVAAYLPVTLQPGHRPGPPAQLAALTRGPGVVVHSGSYPLTSAILRVHGLTAGVEAEGRDQATAAVDQPKLTAGSWVRPGGVVIERTFVEALGTTAGARITLNGRPFTVTGIAVTAANPPYPNLCYVGGGGCHGNFSRQIPGRDIGLIWMTTPDARKLATSANPVSTYVLDLRLTDPARAQAFANRYSAAVPGVHPLGPVSVITWQGIAAADGLLIRDEQQVLAPGAWLLGLPAVASVAVLVGGRMAEHTRRVGLLKAAGGTPGLVAAALLAENLILALIAAAAGLVPGPNAGRRHRRCAYQHDPRAGRRGPQPEAAERADQDLPQASGAAAVRAAAGRPQAPPRPAERRQHRGHRHRDRRRARLPRDRWRKGIRRDFRAR